VRDIFASVTRYPLDVLELNASLEEDLGIDSVKAGRSFRSHAGTIRAPGEDGSFHANKPGQLPVSPTRLRHIWELQALPRNESLRQMAAPMPAVVPLVLKKSAKAFGKYSRM